MFLHLSDILFTGGCTPSGLTPPWADTPRPKWPLKRAVRILLECILVYFKVLDDFIKKRTVQLAELKEIFLNMKKGGALSDSSSER